MKTVNAWSLLLNEPEAWDPATYENAKNLVCALRCAGVPETDSDLQLFIQKIGHYHRAQFEADHCLTELWAFYNAA